MKIYFATDHAGFELKEKLVAFVHDDLGHDVEDLGAYEMKDGDDYPEIIARASRKVSEGVARGQSPRAIILGGSGQGEAMVANRFKGARATVWYGGNEDIIKLSREHNDANILSIGARFVSEFAARDMVALWLTTDFSGDERHVRRIKKIDSLTSSVKQER